MPLLPLFPLEVVLLPDTPLPLHIFEPRYKQMIGECLEGKTPFGVVRALEDGIAETGCTAEIVAVTKKYDDGRLDIVTQGRERFEVIEVNRDREFLRAEVLLIPDEPGGAADRERELAVERHREILALAGAVQDLSGSDDATLSFHLAGSLPLDLDFKQKLLTMRSESNRLKAVAEYFGTLLPNLQRAARVRDKVRGNGHAH